MSDTTPQDAFVLADQALDRVVQQIGDDQWDQPVPADFQTMGGGSPTLREVIGSHAQDEAWIPDMFAGRTVDEVGADAFSGDLLGDDPKAAFSALVATGVAAAEQLTDLDRVIHYSYGDYPARDALWHVISFRGLRAVDIARVIGVDETLQPELVQAMWDAFLPEIETWRAMGVFGPEVPVDEDAPLQQRLLGMTGRAPTA